ncbi:hypothetical protein J6G99_00375 [bacterium]|nr:hypothetical protein [bacterium]
MDKNSEEKNKYCYITIKGNLNKIWQIHNKKIKEMEHTIIIRTPKNLPVNCEDIEILYKCCKKMHKAELQVIIFKELITLSPKMFMTLYALLTFGDISSLEYNKIIFRRKKEAKTVEKDSRDIVKSIYDLKLELKKYYENNADIKYEDEFAMIAEYDNKHCDYTYINHYSYVQIPDFMKKQRVSVQK